MWPNKILFVSGNPRAGPSYKRKFTSDLAFRYAMHGYLKKNQGSSNEWRSGAPLLYRIVLALGKRTKPILLRNSVGRYGIVGAKNENK